MCVSVCVGEELSEIGDIIQDQDSDEVCTSHPQFTSTLVGLAHKSLEYA